MFDWLRRAIVKEEAGSIAKQIREGGTMPEWLKNADRFLQGWKSWLVAIVAVYKLACHDCAASGYLGAVMSAFGYDKAAAAFDPKEALAALLVIWAIGGHLWSAVQQYRRGVPLIDLHSPARVLYVPDRRTEQVPDRRQAPPEEPPPGGEWPKLS